MLRSCNPVLGVASMRNYDPENLSFALGSSLAWTSTINILWLAVLPLQEAFFFLVFPAQAD